MPIPVNRRDLLKMTVERYFEEITRKRYQGRDWHVPIIAKFGFFRGKRRA